MHFAMYLQWPLAEFS